MKFLDLFSGIGGFRESLEANGHECVGYVEKDKFARKSYQAMYNTENEWTKEDITAVTNEEFAELKGKVDIITGGFPCFAAGTLITTSKGMKNIEEIVKGDLVLTHTNTFQKVIEPMKKHKKGIYELKIKSSTETFVTEEHPYYVKEVIRSYSEELGEQIITYSEPKWVEVKDLLKKEYVFGFAQNNLEKSKNISEDDAETLGKAIFTEYNKVDFDSSNLFKNLKLNKMLAESDTADRYSRKYINQLSGDILNLPPNLLKIVLEQIIYSQKGLKHNAGAFINVESKKFAYTLQQAFQKAYKSPSNIVYLTDTEEYLVSYDLEGTDVIPKLYMDGMFWYELGSLDYIEDWEGSVYNFEVAEDNSYVANNATVHNCQSFSIAGKRLGFSDETRGTLFFDIIRAAEVLEPKILFLENVKGLLNHDSGNTFKVMIGALEELGYKVDYKVFNSKYFGVPQNRERIFIVATKNYEKNWYLKDIVDGHRVVEKRILDVLEDSVDDKFYLSGERVQRILDNLNNPLATASEATLEPAIQNPLKNQTEFGWHFEQAVYKEEGLTRTLKAGGGSGNIPKVLRQTQAVSVDSSGNPKITVLGNTSRTSYNSSNVHDTFGISPTLAARDFKGPKQIAYIDGEEYIIRKLTPLETWRLQGFPDESFHKASEVNSNSQLYKQSGNSVTVNVIKSIAENF